MFHYISTISTPCTKVVHQVDPDQVEPEVKPDQVIFTRMSSCAPSLLPQPCESFVFLFRCLRVIVLFRFLPVELVSSTKKTGGDNQHEVDDDLNTKSVNSIMVMVRVDPGFGPSHTDNVDREGGEGEGECC